MVAIHMNNEEGNGPLCGSRGTGHIIDIKNITCKRCLKKMGTPVEPKSESKPKESKPKESKKSKPAKKAIKTEMDKKNVYVHVGNCQLVLPHGKVDMFRFVAPEGSEFSSIKLCSTKIKEMVDSKTLKFLRETLSGLKEKNMLTGEEVYNTLKA